MSSDLRVTHLEKILEKTIAERDALGNSIALYDEKWHQIRDLADHQAARIKRLEAALSREIAIARAALEAEK